MKNMSDYFFLRADFDRFMVEPERHPMLLIGEKDRRQRDATIEAIEEGCYGMEGHKAVVFGDFGRGKTHEAHNLIFEAKRRNLPIAPVYVSCHEFHAKEPFSTLFAKLVEGLGVEDVQRVAREYGYKVQEEAAEPILDVVQSDEIASVFVGLEGPNPQIVRKALRWLGGKGTVKQIGEIAEVTEPLTLSHQFAAVMKGLSHMYRVVDQKVLIFLIDEAERLGLVTHNDTYWSWIGCLRALTSLHDVGFVIYVGAGTQDELPNILTWDEIVTRIGSQNYVNLFNPSREDLAQWVVELLQTTVRKGPLPSPHSDVLTKGAADETIPDELRELASDEEALRAYPFTPEALDRFVTLGVTQHLANRPRDTLKRLQSCAKRAMRLGERLITSDLIDQVVGDTL